MNRPLLNLLKQLLPQLWQAFLWLVVFAPGIFMAVYVRNHAVDVLCFDDWENVPLLKKWHDGTWSFADFWSLQIQHRPVIPRMIVIMLAFLGEGDNRWGQYFSFCLSALTAVLVVLLMRKTLGASRWIKPLAFAANCLIFSPVLFQNFFWATLFWMALPVPCVLGALLILGTRRPLWLRFALSLMSAVIATLSFSHGLVMWPVLGCYVLLQPEIGPLKLRIGLAAAVAVTAAATFAAYFNDFQNQSFHAYELKVGENALVHTVSLLDWQNFSRVVRFACGLIGNGLARSAFDSHHLVVKSQIFGGIIVVALMLISIACVCSRQGRCTWSRTLPWLALTAYGAGMALAVAAGRAHLGEQRCVVPRYFVGTMFVTISVVVVGFLLLREAVSHATISPLWSRRARYLGVSSVTTLIVFQWPLWQYGLHLAHVWNHSRYQAKGLLMFIQHDELAPWSLNTLDNIREFCKQQANTLKELGLLRTRPVETPSIKEFRRDRAKVPVSRANVDSIQQQGDSLVLRGHARFGPERPADVVLLTLEGKDRIIALGIPRPRPLFRLFNVDYEFTNFLDVPLDDLCLWEARIPLASLPQEARSLEVWALDSERRRIARFDRKLILPALRRGTMR